MTNNGEDRGLAIDRVLEALEVAGGPDSRGEYRAFCPAHDDRKTPNLHIREAENGRVLLRCFAGCGQDEVLDALEDRGIGRAKLFAARNGVSRGGGYSIPSKTTATAQPCTLEAYAAAKNLPVALLEQLGITDARYSGKKAIRIPYLNEDGSEVAVRYRLALKKGTDGDGRFRWRKGSKPTLYGLWRLEHTREAGYAYLVEGESDCHTLWNHGLPALGVPGAGTWRNEWTERLEGVEKLYAVIEPDAGGEAFWEQLTASPIREKLYRVDLDGVKDVSELHLSGPDEFLERLEEARTGARAWLDLAETEQREKTRKAWATCERLAHEPDILERFATELKASGFAGETRAAKLLYLALVSRLLHKIVSVAVKGPSSGGKTYLVERVLDYFPDSAYHAMTAMSEKALAYSEEPIRHRFLVIFEAEGMASDFATYLMRSLLSEGRLRYEVVEKTSEGLKPRLIEREGPTGLIVTTTAVRLHPENETRLLSLTVSDTSEQTRDVISALAAEEAHSSDLSPWHALQEWLEGADHRVTIPYAKDLAELVPPIAVRLRRDFGAVLNLIRAHAVLHGANRERDGQRIVATLGDYAAVRGLIADLISEGIEATVPKTVRETVSAVERLLEDSEDDAIPTVAVARELELDKSAALRRVRNAIDRGHLKNLEDRRGRPARLVLDEPLPEDLEILPTVERLRGCTVAVGNEGINNPPSANGREELTI